MLQYTVDVQTRKKVGELRGDIGAIRQVLTPYITLEVLINLIMRMTLIIHRIMMHPTPALLSDSSPRQRSKRVNVD